MSEKIIEIENLSMYFTAKSSVLAPARTVKAVKGVTMHVNHGETFGLVGALTFPENNPLIQTVHGKSV